MGVRGSVVRRSWFVVRLLVVRRSVRRSGFGVRGSSFEAHRCLNPEPGTWNPNDERRTTNHEPRTTNPERRTPNQTTISLQPEPVSPSCGQVRPLVGSPNVCRSCSKTRAHPWYRLGPAALLRGGLRTYLRGAALSRLTAPLAPGQTSHELSTAATRLVDVSRAMRQVRTLADARRSRRRQSLHHRRKRRRQGRRRAVHSRSLLARDEAVHRSQLRRHRRHVARDRALRARPRQLHRRLPGSHGPPRSRASRNHLSG